MSQRIGREASATTAPPVADLTARLTRGEEAAYRQFFDGFFDRLLRYLLVLARGDETLAREALAATLPKVVRHARPFATEAAFWSWLTVLARTALVDIARRDKRYRERLDQLSGESRPNLNGSANPTLLALLAEGVAGLGTRERELLEGKYYRGSTNRELAAATGSTTKAVESRLVRIRRRLRRFILERLDRD